MKGKPLSITIVCTIGFIGAIFALPLIFSSEASFHFTFAFFVGVVCLFGIWQMKRWALITYAIFACVNQLLQIIAGKWHPVFIIMPVLVILIGFANFGEMD